MKIICLFITSLFFCTFLRAIENQSALDLKQVIKIAKENNPNLLSGKEKLNELEAQKNITRSLLYPTLNWNLNGNYLKDAVYTGSPKFGGDPYNLYTSDLKLTQTIYSHGSISAIKQNEITKQIQYLNLEIIDRNLTQNIISAFYLFILNQHSLENLQKTEEIIQKALKTATDRYNIGRGQMLDVLQVKTQLALISPQIEQAKNLLESSANQLSYYMGKNERINFLIRGELKTIPLNSIQKVISLKNYHLPEYEINKMQITSLDYSKEVVKGKSYPNLKLVGDYLYNNYKKSDLFSDYSHSWSVQLQLNIPLFSGFSSHYENLQFASEEIQLHHTKNDLENSLSLNQLTSLKYLEAEENSLTSAMLAANLAEQSQKEAHRNYKLATIDFLQFLTVEQAALQAKTALNLLKYQSIIAYTNYFIASGQPLSILVDNLLNSEN